MAKLQAHAGCGWEGVPPLIFTCSSALPIIPFTFVQKGNEAKKTQHWPWEGLHSTPNADKRLACRYI